METKPISLKKLAEKLNLKFSGNGDLKITKVCGLNSLQKGGLAYLTNPDGMTNVPVPSGMPKKIHTTIDDFNSSNTGLIVPLEFKDRRKNPEAYDKLLMEMGDTLDFQGEFDRSVQRSKNAGGGLSYLMGM